jgi:hypothetical protein
MKKRVVFTSLLAVLALCLASPVHSQGIQTGILLGKAVDAGGLVLPGVVVTVSSPSLQGVRTTVTDGNGVYVLRGLPPGVYTVAFELAGFKGAEQPATVELGKQTVVEVALALAGIAETVQVTGQTTEAAIATPTAGANYTHKEINSLPAQTRTLFGIAQLSPGLTSGLTTPNVNQVTISGAFAYDNVFLVDGVDVNDNLFGTANNLFIEDAIEETQVLTSGISAEYGRFSGGVVNAVTKSGGDIFSGSYRLNLTNDAWQTESPYEKERDITRPDKISYVHEGTVGGPIVRRALWFFGAGRYTETSNTNPLPQTGTEFTTTNENERGEVKLTGTVLDNHTVFGSYLRNSTAATRVPFSFTIDPHGQESPTFPNDRWVVGYRGVLTSKAFAEMRWSQKTFGFRDIGGSDTSIVNSPFITLTQRLGHYNAPYFDATDPEDRDNWQVAGNLSYMWTTDKGGSHDLKGGFEVYNSTRTGGNSQSATGYVFDADYLADASGMPLYDAGGYLIPVFVPGESLIENWLPVRNAKIDIRTTSLFVHDRWSASDQWSFDLGVRYERVRSEATGGIVGVDTDTWVPRLAATYDVRGDGQLIAQATYAHYAGKYSEAQFANNTNVGNPSATFGIYTGPAGQGRDFAAGFSPVNYETVDGDFPTANIFFDESLSSPVTREFTASLGTQVGRGYLKGTYIYRSMANFVEDFIDLTTGETEVIEGDVNFGTFTNTVYRNSDDPRRDYQGLQFIGKYPLVLDRWTLAGNYTVQFVNDGNFEGEGTNTPGISSPLGDYPELYAEERHYPEGRLNDYQRHKVRLWTIYTLGMKRAGDVDLSLLYNYNSALTYSHVATGQPLSAIQRTLGAAYASLPSSQSIYFGERGSQWFEGAHVFDFGLYYSIPVFRTLRPYVKLDVFNIFNNDTLTSWNVTVRPDATSPRDALGLATGFTRGSSYGKSVDNNSYPRARAWQVAFGFRF